MKKKWLYVLIAFALTLVAGGFLVGPQPAAQAQVADPDLKKVELGKALFNDVSLSANGTQSCAACHAAGVGYTGPDSAINVAGGVYQGAIPNRFGNRKPPASAYAGDSPALHHTAAGWFGGMFWDGRATGERLGDPLAEQAQGPFLNPLEQALANSQVLCERVKKSSYAALFEEVYGAGALNCATNVDGVYKNIAFAIAAYERSAEVNPYSSKFDLFWDKAKAAGKDVSKIKCPGGTNAMGCGMAGMGGGGMDPNVWTKYRNLGLTDNELMGLAVFNDPNRANCASCHSLQPGPGGRPLLTDFGYENIGVPKNPANPFYKMPKAYNPDGKDWIDTGLGSFLKSAGYPADVYEPEMGKHKVPTLRNVDLRPSPDTVKAYGHNGYFKSLQDIVFFYHWRAAMDNGCMNGGCGSMGGGMGDGGIGGGGMGGGMGGGCDMGGGNMETRFPAPEVDANRAQMKMFPCMQVDNIVTFLKTLSDGYAE